MILKINGVEVAMSPAVSVPSVNFSVHPSAIQKQVDRMLPTLNDGLWRSLVVSCACSMFLWTMTGATMTGGGWPLIHLLQQGAFWIGMAVSLWGVYEWMVGGPGWKERIIKGVLGYLLVLVLPMLFLTIKASGIGM